MEITNYKHKIIEVVKFHEVDMLGVCNNAVYFNYFEDARIKYIQDIISNFSLKEMLEGNSFIIMARNECDYIEPAQLGDELNIYTRIDFIKNSSFGIDHLVENNFTKRIIAKSKCVIVHIDRRTKKPLHLPKEFLTAVQKFETQVKIIKS